MKRGSVFNVYSVGDMVSWFDSDDTGLIVSAYCYRNEHWVYRVYWYSSDTTTTCEKEELCPYNNGYVNV